jgi:hypothetical protein
MWEGEKADLPEGRGVFRKGVGFNLDEKGILKGKNKKGSLVCV